MLIDEIPSHHLEWLKPRSVGRENIKFHGFLGGAKWISQPSTGHPTQKATKLLHGIMRRHSTKAILLGRDVFQDVLVDFKGCL